MFSAIKLSSNLSLHSSDRELITSQGIYSDSWVTSSVRKSIPCVELKYAFPWFLSIYGSWLCPLGPVPHLLLLSCNSPSEVWKPHCLRSSLLQAKQLQLLQLLLMGLGLQFSPQPSGLPLTGTLAGLSARVQKERSRG